MGEGGVHPPKPGPPTLLPLCYFFRPSFSYVVERSDAERTPKRVPPWADVVLEVEVDWEANRPDKSSCSYQKRREMERGG